MLDRGGREFEWFHFRQYFKCVYEDIKSFQAKNVYHFNFSFSLEPDTENYFVCLLATKTIELIWKIL